MLFALDRVTLGSGASFDRSSLSTASGPLWHRRPLPDVVTGPTVAAEIVQGRPRRAGIGTDPGSCRLPEPDTDYNR